MVPVNSEATLLAVRVPAFEAAVRKAMDRRLADRPVVVVTACTPLGRVVAACPVARAEGVREEMPYPAARVACPDAAFCLPDRRLATEAMQLLLFRAGKYSPLVEPAGNGCIVLDTRGTEKLWGDTLRVADRLRLDIVDGVGVPAAAGLATRRPWSLLASRAAGDAGVVQVPPGTEEAFLDAIPATWVDGLTPKSRTLLMEMNIRTLGDLRGFGRMELDRQFGRDCGDLLWQVLHPSPWEGVALLSDEALVEMDGRRVRVEAALTEASVARDQVRLVARSLAARVAATLRARGEGAARLRLTLLYADGLLKRGEARTGGYIQDKSCLMAAAEKLLRRIFGRRVRVSRLWLEAERLSEPQRQGVLFPPEAAGTSLRELPAARRLEQERLLAAVDSIRHRYGEAAVAPAALLSPAAGRRGRPRALEQSA
ncbi:MAG: hypothetical protein LIP77_07710 [Planctomycetes bacterium]|nr:hypothetical protein [Planctomycetota bacterium]